MNTTEIVAAIATGIAGGGGAATGVWAWLRAREKRIAETRRLEVHVTREREETGRHERTAIREDRARLNDQLLAENGRLRREVLDMRDAHARELEALRAEHQAELDEQRATNDALRTTVADLRVADAAKSEALKAMAAKLAHVDEDQAALQRRLDESRAEVKRLQDLIAKLLETRSPAAE